MNTTPDNDDARYTRSALHKKGRAREDGARAALSALGLESLVDVQTLAAYLDVEQSWVYSHADEIGVRRLGSGPKARLRFNLAEVDERLTVCHAGRDSQPREPAPSVASRLRSSERLGTAVDLLPIGGVQQRSEAS